MLFLRRALMAAFAAWSSGLRAQSARSARLVTAGEDRNRERIALGMNPNHCKVSGQDSGGALSCFEATSKAKGGPPLHIHLDQDEWFYVIAGEYAFQVGNEKYRLTAGDSLFAPRKVPHAFARVGEAEGRLLCAFQPAGAMEAFFRELGKVRGVPAPEQMARLFSEHGMKVVGPPMSTD